MPTKSLTHSQRMGRAQRDCVYDTTRQIDPERYNDTAIRSSASWLRFRMHRGRGGRKAAGSRYRPCVIFTLFSHGLEKLKMPGPPKTPTEILRRRGSWRAKIRTTEPQPPSATCWTIVLKSVTSAS